jgi:hypothetical protein
MRFTDLYLTEDSLDSTVSDIDDIITDKVEQGFISMGTDEFLDELNSKGAPLSKSLLRSILDRMAEEGSLITNVSNTEIEFNAPGNVPDEMVPEPQDMEQNASNLATSAANKGIGDDLNV